MRQTWIPLVIVAGVAVLLAFLVLVPLTMGSGIGGPVADEGRKPVDPVPVGEAPPPRPLIGRPGVEPGAAPTTMRTGETTEVNAHAAEGVERRAKPDAVAAGKASAPWSLVRRTILDHTDEESEKFKEEAAQIIADLRQLRRDPDSVDFAALEQRQKDLEQRIRASQHGGNPTIGGALDRLDTIYDEYHQASEE
ncbi:MAG: hypothetical protein R3F61_00980 [Myxococcota bacterium]